MTLVPTILTQGQLDPIVNLKALQIGEEEFQLIPLPALSGTHYNGQTPLIQEVAAFKNELPIAPVTAPVNPTFPCPSPAIVRTQPFVALTPAEIELNREVAYNAYQPPLAVQ